MKDYEKIHFVRFKDILVHILSYTIKLHDCDYKYMVRYIIWELHNLWQNMCNLFEYYPLKLIKHMFLLCTKSLIHTKSDEVEDKRIYVLWDSKTEGRLSKERITEILGKKDPRVNIDECTDNNNTGITISHSTNDGYKRNKQHNQTKGKPKKRNARNMNSKVTGSIIDSEGSSSREKVYFWDITNNIKLDYGVYLNTVVDYYAKTKDYKADVRVLLGCKKRYVYAVLTDLCSSTFLWNTDRFRMAKAVAQHDSFVYELMTKYNGTELRNEGDSFFIFFVQKDDAVNFTFELYNRVTNIRFDDHRNLGIKICVSYGQIIARKFAKACLFGRVVRKTHRMISHTPRNTICIHNIDIEQKYSFVCYH